MSEGGIRYLNSNTLNQSITANIIYDVQDSSPFCLFHSHCLVSVLLAFEFQHRFSLSFFLFLLILPVVSPPFFLYFLSFARNPLIRNKYYVAHDHNTSLPLFLSFCMALAPSFLDYLSLTTTKPISFIISGIIPLSVSLSFFSTIAPFIRPLLLSDYAYSLSAIPKIAILNCPEVPCTQRVK